MANIINHQIKQVNLTFIPEESGFDFSSVDTTRLKLKISEIFSDSKISTTQLPDMLIIFDPNNQINITIWESQNRIIVAFSKLTPYTSFSLENLLKLSAEVITIIGINSKIKAYGLNVISSFDLESIDDSGVLIKDNFISEEIVKKIDGELKSAGVNFVFEKESCRYNLKLEPRFSGLELNTTNSVDANLNAHFKGNPPASADFLAKLQLTYDTFGTNLIKIFS